MMENSENALSEASSCLCQRLRNDFKYITRQTFLGRDAFEVLSNQSLPFTVESPEPAQNSRQHRGDLRIRGIDTKHVIGCDGIAFAAGMMEPIGIALGEMPEHRIDPVGIID